MAKGRTVKYPPKRGNLRRSDVKRAVEKVVHSKRNGGKTGQTHQKATKK